VVEGLALDVAQGWPLGVLVAPGAQLTAPDGDLDFLLALLEEPGEVAAVSWLELDALLALDEAGSVVLLGGVVAVGAGGVVVLGAAPGKVGAAGLDGRAGVELGAWAAAAPTRMKPAPMAPARR
jgi:hypothetical protein